MHQHCFADAFADATDACANAVANAHHPGTHHPCAHAQPNAIADKRADTCDTRANAVLPKRAVLAQGVSSGCFYCKEHVHRLPGRALGEHDDGDLRNVRWWQVWGAPGPRDG